VTVVLPASMWGRTLPFLVHNPAAKQDIRHFFARNCNTREITDGIGPDRACLMAQLSRPRPMRTTASHRAYDHRIRDLVCEKRGPGLFRHIGVPRSTAVSWIRRGPRPVVSVEVLALDHAELQAEVLALRRRIRFLLAIIRLAFLLVRLPGTYLNGHGLYVVDKLTK
jgi:hypothetical protein